MINQILINFFDKFKSGNPAQFALLVTVLTALNILLTNDEFVSNLGAPKWATTGAQIVLLLYTAVKGVDTKSLMNKGGK